MHAIDTKSAFTGSSIRYLRDFATPARLPTCTQNTDEVAQEPVDNITKKGIERVAKSHGHVPAVGDECESESHEDVATPRVKAPVVEGDKQGLLRELVVILPAEK